MAEAESADIYRTLETGNGMVAARSAPVDATRTAVDAQPAVLPSAAPVSGQAPLLLTSCVQGDITFVGQTSRWRNATNFDLNVPAGVQEGDLLIAAMYSRNNSSVITPPAGWILLVNHDRFKVYYRIAPASPPTAYIWQMDDRHRMAGGMLAYRGAHQSNPIHVTGNVQGSSTTTITAPSVTTTIANTLLVAFFGANHDTGHSIPASMTQRYSQMTEDGGGGHHQTRITAADEPFSSTGATGNRLATMAESASNRGVLLALQPAPVQPEVPTGLNVAGTTSRSVSLAWSDAESACWYRMRYRETGTSTWTQSSTFGGTAGTISELDPLTQYDFQVRAENDDFQSAWSSTVTGTTGDPTPFVYTASADNTAHKITTDGHQMWSFTGHSNTVTSVAVGTDGHTYTGSNDNTLRKIDTSGNEIWSFTGQTAIVRSVAVDADGYAYTSQHTNVRKVSPSGSLVWVSTVHTDAVNAVAVDGDGYVYTASRDSTVKKLRPDGSLVWYFTGHDDEVFAVAVDSDGYVYSGSRDQTARKIDPDGIEVWSFTGHTNVIRAISVDADGYLYTASWDRSIRKIAPNGTQVWSNSNHTSAARSVAVGADGSVYSGSGDETARKINSSGTEEWVYTEHTLGVQGIAVEPGAFTIAGHGARQAPAVPSGLSAGDLTQTGATLSWNVADGAPWYRVRYRPAGSVEWTEASPFYGASAAIESLVPGTEYEFQVRGENDLYESAWSGTATGVTLAGPIWPNLYTAGDDHSVRMINAEGDFVWQFDGHTDGVRGITSDADGNVYTASSDHTLRKLDPSGSELWSFSGHSSTVWDVAADADGFTYSASSDGTVRKIDAAGSQVWSFTGHSEPVQGVAVDRDGFVYTASQDSTVRKIAPDGTEIWSFTGHTDRVVNVAVDTLGFVYTASHDNTARKLDPDGIEVWSSTGHTDNVRSVAVDSAGYVYTGSLDNTARKIDPDGIEVWSFTGHTGSVWDVAVDSDGHLYTASYDGTARKISPAGVEVWSYTGHTGPVLDVSADPGAFTAAGHGPREVPQTPSGLAGTGATHEALEINWNSADRAAWYVVRYRPLGTSPWTATGRIYTSGAEIAGLVAETQYEVQVRAKNDLYESAWTASVVLGTTDDTAYPYVYTAAGDSTVKKLDSAGNVIWSYDGHTDEVGAVAVDADGNVYTASHDFTVKKLDPAGVPLWTYSGHTQRLRGITVDADGFVYTSSSDGTARKLRSADGSHVWTHVHGGVVWDLAVDSDGYVYTASQDSTLRKIAPDGTLVWSVSGDYAVRSVAVDANGDVYFGTVHNVLTKLDAFGDELWTYAGHTGGIFALAVDTSGFVYSGSWDQTVRRIDAGGNHVWTYAGHTAPLRHVAVDEFGYVYSASDDGTVRKIDAGGTEIWVYTGHTERVWDVASGKGTFTVAGHGMRPVPAIPSSVILAELSPTSVEVSWDPAESAPWYQVRYRKQDTFEWSTSSRIYETSVEIEGLEAGAAYDFQVRSQNDLYQSNWSETVTFNGPPDGYPFVYTSSHDNTVRKLDSAGTEVWRFEGHTNSVRGLAVDANGYVYTGSWDHTVRKLSPEGMQVWSFTGHTNNVHTVAVDADGFVYTASGDNTVRKLDADGIEVWQVAQAGNPRSVAVDVNGFIYAGMQNGVVTKLRPDGTEAWSFSGHTADIWAIAVDAQGYVYTASGDNTARKISPEGSEIWSFTGHTDLVRSVAVDVYGNVFTASWDGTARKLDSAGNESWSYTVPSVRVWGISIDENGYVYIGLDDYSARKLTPSGNLVWSDTGHTGTVIRTEVDPGRFTVQGHGARPQPATPTGLASTGVTVSTIDVEWTGNSAIPWYQLRHRKTGTSSWTVSNRIYSTSGTIGFLIPGTTYDIQVRAQNDRYDSPWSAAVEVETAADANFPYVYTGSADNSARKLNSDGTQVWSFTGHSDDVRAVAVDQAGYVYTASADQTVRKVDPSGSQVWSFSGHTAIVHAVAVDADGYVYSSSADNTVRKISPAGAQIWSYTGHTDEVWDVAVDSDGYVYTASDDETVRKLRPDGTLAWTYTGFSDRVRGIAVDRHGHVYAGTSASGEPGVMRKLDPDGNPVWSYGGHMYSVRRIAVDTDGFTYTASWDETAHKVDPNGDHVWTFSGHTAPVRTVAVDDAGYVYTSANDNTARKLNPNGGQVWSFTGHSNDVWGVAAGRGAFTTAGHGPRPVPGVPQGVVATDVTSSAITVAWQSASSAPWYQVRHRAAGTSTWTTSGTIYPTTTEISGLTGATGYEFQVRSQNDLHESNWSATYHVATEGSTKPGTPTYSAVATTTLTVNWTAATGADSYRIERAQDIGGFPGTFSEIATTASLSHDDSGLFAGMTYWYRIRAVAGAEDGLYSNASSVTTQTDGGGNWYGAAWQYRRKITVDPAWIDSDLTGFPVYVDLSDLGSAFFSNVKSGGEDILVTAADGTTKLSREVVTIDVGGNTGELHFKAPLLSSTAGTEFYIYYGNSAANETNDAATWPDYRGIWHLQETGSGNTGEFKDATAYGNDGDGGSGSASNTPAAVSGQIERAQDFDPSGDHIRIPYHASLAISTDITVSAWVNLNALSTGDSNIRVITSRQDGLYERNWWLVHWDNKWRFRTYVSGAHVTIESDENSAAGEWVHLAVTGDGSTLRMYVNGVLQQDTGAYTTLETPTTPAYIGAQAGNDRYFDGKIDEVRISGVSRSGAWIKAKYYNQINADVFYDVGDEEIPPSVFFSRTSGNWSEAAAWSYTGHGGDPAPRAPVTSDDVVLIGNNHTLALDADITITSATVDATGRLDTGAYVLSGTGSFTLRNGGILGIGSAAGISSTGAMGNIQMSGTRTYSPDGSYVYNGSVAQVIGTGLPSPVANLTIDNSAGASVDRNVIVTGNLMLSSGTLTVPSGLNLLAASTGVSSGDIRFEREIADPGGWRVLSAPVASTYADFLDGMVTQGISGSTYPAKQPNVLLYDETEPGTDNQRWRKPDNLSDPLPAGRGLFVYVFGDVENDPDYNIDLPLTLDITGLDHPLVAGNFDFEITYTSEADSGWNLIGNPFGATLDWNDHKHWTRSNVDQAIYIWDPTANNGYGEYLVSNSLGGSHDGLIAPFQGFWVKANAPNPMLIANKNARTIGGVFYKHGGTHPAITLELEGGGLTARTFFTFSDDGRTGKDRYDAYRLVPLTDTFLELYSLLPSGPQLAINNLPRRFSRIYEIPVGVGGTRKGKAIGGSFEFTWPELSHIPEEWAVTLVDQNTGDEIDLRRRKAYSFTLDDPKSPAQSFVAFGGNINLVSSRAPSSARFILRIDPGEGDPDIPSDYQLAGNYPNPFNPSTTIPFGVPEESHVEIVIYDVLGRMVERLVSGTYEAGYHQAVWNAAHVASGTYFYRMHVGSEVRTAKMMLAK